VYTVDPTSCTLRVDWSVIYESRIRKHGRIGYHGKDPASPGRSVPSLSAPRDISASRYSPVVTFPWRTERSGVGNFVSCGQFKDLIVQLDPLDTASSLGSDLASDM
jgi:hypothetical protein